MKLKHVQTCAACPEQYDVFLNDQYVAYYRLRHGVFTASCEEEVVYTGYPQGDGLFDNHEERQFYLHEADRAVMKHIIGPYDSLVSDL